MKAFTEPLKALGEFESIRDSLKKQKGMTEVQGCIDAQKAHFIYGLSEDFLFRVIVTYSELRAREIYDNYRCFDKDVLLFPARDLIFYSADIHSSLIVQQRIRVLEKILSGKGGTIITTMGSCMDHLLPLGEFQKNILKIEIESTLDLEELKKTLVSLGYERMGQVEGEGQFAIRGGILDIFPLTEETPVRVELWGDEVDSIRSFDVESQRSIENLEELVIYPATEVPADSKRIEEGLKRMEADVKAAKKAMEKQGNTEGAHRLGTLFSETKEKLTEFQGQGSLGLDGIVDYFYKETVSFPQYLDPERTLFVLDEPNRVQQEGEAIETEFQESMTQRLEKGYLLPGQMKILFGTATALSRLTEHHTLGLSTLEAARGHFQIVNQFSMSVRSVNPYNNSFELLVKDLARWKKEGYRVILLSGSRTRAERLAADLTENGVTAFYSEDMDRVPKPGEIMTACGNIHRGFEYPLIKFVVISESDVFGKDHKKKKRQKTYEGQKIQSFTELSVGDYVVHENHGLGVYRGIEKIVVDKVAKDYMKIEYAGKSFLYVLATQLDAIQKYAGADAKQPKLNKLGTQDWNKTKTRVRTAVKAIAQDLVKLYAVRQAKNGFVYSEDSIWQREFEEAFPYEETDDQLAAIEATKKDMESTKIMDRLICGDVGYGKTEIAIRAAFKAVQDGKQVVFLVPTTILAQQHYNNFVQRMKDFPVRVDLLCRFRTPKEQTKTLTDVKKGLVDILIGTHRVLSKDVQFKDLGLLIIDEEQRFGVEHKETLKALRTNVDVLSLSATPIPRTLEMAVTGIREMSTLATPPEDRLPVLTYVGAYEDAQVTAAVRRELLRGGQVFYVHNRVQDISSIADKIHTLVPEAHVGIAHGKMGEKQLDQIIRDFWHRDIDVLVCTTIIETGLDISNANTLIVDHADRFGLSQLHQLRGRVGRGRERAYAYFLYDPSKPMTEQSHDRLATIAQNTALGSGFDVAMKDLELRGTGNLLGDEQSGHIEGVGFDLYVRMVSEAVEKYKEPEENVEPVAVSIDLPIEASIPIEYIDSDKLRLEAYRKLASARNEADLKDLEEELTDRYGKPPVEFETLFDVARLKFKARKLGISEILAQSNRVRIGRIDPPESIQMRMGRIYKGTQYRPVTHQLIVPTPFTGSLGQGPMSSDQVVLWTNQLLDDLAWTPSSSKRQSRL